MKIIIERSHIESFVLFALFFALFPIDSFSVVEKWHVYHIIQSIVFFLFSLSIVLVMALRREFPGLCLFFVTLMIYYLLNSFLNDGNLYTVKILKIYISIIILAYVIYHYSIDDGHVFINTGYIFFSTMIYINAIYMYFFPDGIGMVRGLRTMGILSFNRVNFLAVDNRLVVWFIPAIMFAGLNTSKLFIKRFNDIILCFIILTQMIYVWSATGIIGVIAAIILVFNSKFMTFLSTRRVVISYIIVSIGVIMFNMQKLFVNIIVSVLQKTLDFSSRVEIWLEALRMIQERPVFGYGYANNGIVINAHSGIWYAHNLFLDILIQGGVFLLILFVFFFIILDNKTHYRTHFQQVVICSFAAFMITAITESYLANVQFFLVLILLYYSSEFGKQYEKYSLQRENR